MDSIKLATPEQVTRIQETSDLGPTSMVYAMGEDLAVVKTVVELDPVYFQPDSTTSRRLLFIWGLENAMRLAGSPSYYFSTLDADIEWKHVVETHGAVATSTGPETRYKKVLL